MLKFIKDFFWHGITVRFKLSMICMFYSLVLAAATNQLDRSMVTLNYSSNNVSYLILSLMIASFYFLVQYTNEFIKNRSKE